MLPRKCSQILQLGQLCHLNGPKLIKEANLELHQTMTITMQAKVI